MAMDHPRIPDDIAEAIRQARPQDEPHIKARMLQSGSRRTIGGIWSYYQELVSSDM